ncbi:unnamed protein product [Phytophthora fragariaefolia]|uniref:Unnamed protein product n=1 Tax=Phytophthora fragariaefolia TaxID=1490495 RepID=A0A9W6X106_9STRA|nr:unnamed protein product [Phytophthora fragariaefolia]
MPVLSAAKLPSETLYAGAVLEYYSMVFVCGDARGHRVATILSVDDTEGEPYPVTVDTGEMIPLTNMVKLHADRFGNRFKTEYAKWRKLKTFHLSADRVQASARSSTLNAALKSAVEAAFVDTRRILAAEREERGCIDSGETGTRSGESEAIIDPTSRSSIAREVARVEMPRTAITSYEADVTPPSEENAVIPDSASPSAIIDLVSSDCEPDGVQGPLAARAARAKAVKDQALEVHCIEGEIARGEPSVEAPSDAKLLKLQEYVKSIPTRGQREKIRHQATK